VRVRKYPLVEAQGLVWIWMSADPRFDGQPPEPPPTIPGVVGGKPKLVDHLDYDIHIDHAVLGLIDPAHGPFVHQQWWWRTTASQHEKRKAFAPSEAGFTMTRHEPQELQGLRHPGRRAPDRDHLPPAGPALGACEGRRQAGAGPVGHDPDQRRQDPDEPDHLVRPPGLHGLYPVIRLAARAFLRQDGRIVAAQTRGLRDNPALMWVGDADQQGRWYHQLKREWNASRREGRDSRRAFRNPVTETTLRWRT
jgi:phenylpropionate dioxygenase-like ring-hydroxylating dioxygenase large terminal subunit